MGIILTTLMASTVGIICAPVWVHSPAGAAIEYPGFIEAYRTIELSFPESGIVNLITVDQGQSVRKGETIAQLDNRVLKAARGAAIVRSQAQGVTNASMVAVRQKQLRLEKLKQLRSKGHASQEEIDLAEAEVQIAEANLQTAREQTELQKQEVARIEAQLEQRIVHSPVDGVVVEILKEPGESVTANDSIVAKIVVLKMLKANFFLPSSTAQHLKSGDRVDVVVGRDQNVDAMVEFVSPVTDSESDTVRVQVRIDNSSLAIRCGIACSLVPPFNKQGHATIKTKNHFK